MNPRASAPRIRSGSFGPAHSASRSTASRSAFRSASSGMMSLKTMPGSGKSGTSRTFAARSTAVTPTTSSRRHLPQRAPEEQLRQVESQRRQLLQVLEAALAALRVARAQRRGDDLLQQPRLAVRPALEGPQMPRRETEAPQPGAHGGDRYVALRVVHLPVALTGLDQAVALHLVDELDGDPGLFAEVIEVDLVLAAGEAPRAAAPPVLAGGHRQF